MSIEYVRLSQQAKEQLIRIKRSTGLQHWNVICRWAFCMSLQEPSIPSPSRIVTDSSVEMSWKVFGGEFHEIYFALLKERVKDDGFDINDEILTNQFKLHLHRGIGYFASKVSDKQISQISDLIYLASSARTINP